MYNLKTLLLKILLILFKYILLATIATKKNIQVHIHI